MPKYKIGFLSNKLTLRGTEIALYDYAHFNEILLGNKSIIITRDFNLVDDRNDLNIAAYDKFKNRFEVEYYISQPDIDNIVIKHELTHLYIIKAGGWDGLISTKCKNLIHCVFFSQHKHGEVYSVISNNVNLLNNTNYPVVPHMIYNSNIQEDLREKHIDGGIPNDAIVFGRSGGIHTFDIQFVHETIAQIVNTRKDIYFLFLNTEPFYYHHQIIYLNGTTNMDLKRIFINTCDAMLHARASGETFGLTCGEFAIQLKPVIIYRDSPQNNHIEILGEKAILYSDANELHHILTTFHKEKYDMQENGYLNYTPEKIMQIFKYTYLDDDNTPNNNLYVVSQSGVSDQTGTRPGESPLIYINGFWNGFTEKTDANAIDYFLELFKKIPQLATAELTDNINKATILFESVFNRSYVNEKKWDLTICYNSEPYRFHEDYDIILDSELYNDSPSLKKYIDLPHCIYYMNRGVDYGIDALISRPDRIQIPLKFCCFIVSNGGSPPRNYMFELLSQYKHVDSLGKYENNVGNPDGIDLPYWSKEYLNLLSEYKFIICFENTKKGTYATEKIVNPFLAHIIPIYWGSKHTFEIFNRESILYLEDEFTHQSYVDLIYKIIELDQNDTKYLEFVNRPCFTKKNIEFIETHYSLNKIAKQMESIINL